MFPKPIIVKSVTFTDFEQKQIYIKIPSARYWRTPDKSKERFYFAWEDVILYIGCKAMSNADDTDCSKFEFLTGRQRSIFKFIFPDGTEHHDPTTLLYNLQSFQYYYDLTHKHFGMKQDKTIANASLPQALFTTFARKLTDDIKALA